jgi:hypothetical protein
MKRATGRNSRLWATIVMATCMVVLLMLALWQSVWAQGDCHWEKVFWIDDQGPFPPSSGASVVVSNVLTIVDTLWCEYPYDWHLAEFWEEPPLSLASYEYQVPSTTTVGSVTQSGKLWWYGGDPSPAIAGVPVVLTKTLHVESPGWGVSSIIEELDFSFEGNPTSTDIIPLELSEMVEGGDAPSSHNHSPAAMTAYPPGGPAGVTANYPVVWDWDGTLGAGTNSDYGFCHWSSGSPSFLGNFFTWELDADLTPDHDGVTNIDPQGDAPDRDSVITPFSGDDGMQFPTVLPSCGTAMVPIQGSNNSGGTLYLNVWADWTRDGDWGDASLCTCGVDEWAIKDYAVTAPGPFAVNIPITPCHPGGDPSAPLWVRVTLDEVALVALGTPWSWGGQPYPAFDPTGGPHGCFVHGETEDYYVEPVAPACDWVKQISINEEYAGDWEVGDPDPFGVVLSDTITISDALHCNFLYDWDLGEYWDPAVISRTGHDNSHGSVTPGSGEILWSGGYPDKMAPGTWVTLTKTLHVENPEWIETVIEETLSFSPEGIVEPMTRTVTLMELVEGGDAPSSHNHSSSIMHTYNPASGGVQAKFPVVWDATGALSPGPGGGAYAPGYYGFCHFSAANPSFLGNGLTFEFDADLLPDQDPSTNINPPADTPNWDLMDDGVTFPSVLSHCGPATLLVQGENNSGGTLYLNAWADWSRDGDWEDTSLCECAIDEWIIQDYPVPAPSSPPYTFALPITIVPCHPVADATSPLWMRVTLSGLKLQSYGPPFTYGGFPFSEAAAGCFPGGETEDYFVESFDVCWWDKEVSIDGEGPYRPEEGPFSVVISDTVTIADALSCTFDFDWDLLEQWDPDALSLQSEGHSHGDDDWDSDHYHWYLPSASTVQADTVVTMNKELHVDALPGLTSTVINETLDFIPGGMVPTWDRPIVLRPLQTCLPLTMKRY